MKKENVKVEVGKGKGRRPVYSETGVLEYEDAPAYVITAINNGHRSVMLREVQLWVENIKKLNLRNWLPETYAFKEGKAIQHTLPFDLNPGADFPCKIISGYISRALIREGYSGEIKLIAHFISATNHTFKSDPFWYQIETSEAR